MLHDAHLHLRDHRLLEEMMKHNIYGIANAATVQEYEQLLQYQKAWNRLSISAGIHPWSVETMTWKELYPIMKEVNIIGEIGLDTVWCDTSIDLQTSVFEQSLSFAMHYQKPVILHIKGMEKEALSYLKQYPNTYLVHWYSCSEYLQDYIDLDCYFTIGPSVGTDEAVTKAAKQVPLNRLLLETDGIEAVSWCDQHIVDISDYHMILQRSLHTIVRLRECDQELLLQQMNNTYMEFLRITESRA